MKKRIIARPRANPPIPRRKMKRTRRGASVTVYLDFELLAAIRMFADREDLNFNDAIRELLHVSTEAFLK